jgi:hypothetical protein
VVTYRVWSPVVEALEPAGACEHPLCSLAPSRLPAPRAGSSEVAPGGFWIVCGECGRMMQGAVVEAVLAAHEAGTLRALTAVPSVSLQ